MTALDLMRLPQVMALTSGTSEVVVGLLDGPITSSHRDLSNKNIQIIPGASDACTQTNSIACRHGTFVAGILMARRGSSGLAICPDCSLLVRSIFPETTANGELLPSVTPQHLAVAISDCVNTGAEC
jgi:hypothetical protein